MKQVDVIEKDDLSELVKMLEAHDEDVIYLAKDGVPVAQVTLLPSGKAPKRRIGIAKGEFTVPDDFDKWDKEIEEMFDKDIFE